MLTRLVTRRSALAGLRQVQILISAIRTRAMASAGAPAPTGAAVLESSAPVAAGGPVQQAIVAKLREKFAPIHLEIENESYKHSVPRGSESHFKLLIVSDAFEGKAVIARHRLVNDAVKEIGGGEMPVHALSISAKAPSQWTAGEAIHATPNCKGGAGK